MTSQVSRRPGRPSAASREDVLLAARVIVLGGRLPDMSALAQATGVGRTSLYRWFGDRDGLLGEVIAAEVERRLRDGYRRSEGRNGGRVADAIEHLLADAAAIGAIVRLLRQEPQVMLTVMSDPSGAVRAGSIGTVGVLLEQELAAGRIELPLPAEHLAEILIGVGQALLWARAATGEQADVAATVALTRQLLIVLTQPDAQAVTDGPR